MMARGWGVLVAVVACMGVCAWCRVLPRATVDWPLAGDPPLRLNEVAPGTPDYLSRSVLDYPLDARERLLAWGQDPEVAPGLFEGDMAGLRPEHLTNTRVGLKWDVFPERRWDNATVPYAISSRYLPSERKVIEAAISTLDFMTCIKFEPWDGVVEDYLLIWPVEKPAGCWSFVGKTGGQQVLSLQRPDARSRRCFASVGKPIHELLHALGLFHEQTRADRDDFVTIVNDNIIPQYKHNFAKQSQVNTTFPFAYDYNSVMHYGPNFFSASRGKPTIVPKASGVKIGQRRMLSQTDCLKLNQLYGCLDGSDFDRSKYLAFCSYLGL